MLGLIPARGGSKGIARKNIKKLGGKELIRYTIDAALACDSLSCVVVSTEDEEIAAISRNAGAEVPFLRPTALAADHSPTIETVLHALKYFRETGVLFEAVCLLQPTTPFRSPADIRLAVRRYSESGADSLISVRQVPHQFNPHWVFEPVADDQPYLQLACGDREIIPRRQELPPAYYRDGAIYITDRELLVKRKTFYGERLAYCLLEGSPDINIDTPADWERAEQFLRQQLG